MTRPIETTAIALALILLASGARACGPNDPQDGCHPPPVVLPEPPRPVTQTSDSDPLPVTVQPIWMPCARDGERILYHVEAWLRIEHGKEAARKITVDYCTSLPREAIPENVAWVAK